MKRGKTIILAGLFLFLAAGLAQAAFQEIGFFDLIGNTVVRDVKVVGNYAYVAADAYGLRVVDISNPAAPVEVGAVDTPGQACQLAVVGPYIYIADASGGVRMIDVSTPSAPREVASIAPAGASIVSLIVDGSSIYAASDAAGGSGIYFFGYHKLSNSIIQSSFLATPYPVLGLTKHNSTVYAAAGSAGLRIFDYSNTSSPVAKGFVDTAGMARQVAVMENYAYLADGTGGLRVIDVADITAPVEVDSMATSGEAQGVRLSGATAYLADGSGGVRAIDVGNPAAPVALAAFDTPGVASSLDTMGSMIFVADGSGDLRILQFGNPGMMDSTLKLWPTDGVYSGWFGEAVAMTEEWSVVGAPLDRINGQTTASGSVYVYANVGGIWVQRAKLTASDELPGDSFGDSLAVSGNRIAVAAPFADAPANNSGAVYVFFFDGNNWVQQAKLVADSSVAEDTFGRSVAIDGDYIIVGANGDDTFGRNSGAAYVFHYEGGAWVRQAKLTASDAGNDDNFANAVSISGDLAAVATPFDTDKGSLAGAAYLFRREPGGAWVQQTKLTASDGSSSDAFGVSVALSGNRLLVGAYGADGITSGSGAAYVFEFDGSHWVQQTKLTAPDGKTDDTFGRSVAVVANRAVISAPRDLNEWGYMKGAAYIFDISGGSWVLREKLVPRHPAFVGGTSFGYSVALAGQFVLTGMHGEYYPDYSSGAAYLYSENTVATVDTDMDGVPDIADNCPNLVNSNQANTDNDGLGDLCDNDDDNDGILDGSDNCSLTVNPDQADADGDGIGNVCDLDADNDGAADSIDNCPTAVNANQGDFDADGVGDVCDPYTVSDQLWKEVGSLALANWAEGVDVNGQLVGVASFDGGLRTVDVTNPSAPVLLGALDTPGMAEGVVLSGATAYVADSYSGLRLANVLTPAFPTALGSLPGTGSVFEVAVVGTVAYLADDAPEAVSHLRLVDVSNPSSPQEIGASEIPSSNGESRALGIAVAGHYAYLATGSSGLRVFDVTDMNQPVEVGSTPPVFDRRPTDVTVAGGYAYLSDWYGGLQIVDITTPTAPVEVGYFDAPAESHGVAVVGTTAFLANGNSGLWVVDVTTPSVPVLLAHVDTPGYALEVAATGGLAFVADRSGGLRIFRDVADLDGDGRRDGNDNCPAISNPSQANFDGDAMGDACDDDDDNDGIADAFEIFNGTDPYNPDITPPVVSLSSALTGMTRLTSTTVTYSTSEGVVTLSRNGNAVSVASGGTLTLQEGRNSVVASARDAAGNVGMAQVTIDVDTVVAAPSVDPLPSPWSLPSCTLSGRMEDGATMSVVPPAGTSAGPVTYPTASSWNCTVTGLNAGSQTFSVIATDAAGNQSSAATATLLVDLGLPPQVTGLSATDTYQGGTVLVSWSGYAYPAAGYALYVAPAPFTSVADLTPWRTYAAGTSSATVTGLADGQTAYLAVVAIGSGGQFIGTVICTPIVPTRQGLYGTVRDYVRNFPLNGMYVQVDGYPATSTGIDGRYVLTGLPAGSYSVTIGEIGGDVRYTTRSYSGVTVSVGQMLAKELYIFSKTHNLDCGVPTNLSAVSGDGKVRLTWDPLTAADLAGYFILRDGVQLNATPLTATSYVDMAVVNGTTYAYTIYSYSRGNIPSDPSPTVLATPLAATAPPVDLRASLGCDGRVTLSWLRPAASDVLGYNVYQQAGSGMDYGSFAAVVGADTTTWTSEVLAGGSYTFAVRSVGSSGEEQNTHVVVTVGVPASWNQPRAAIVIPQTGKRVDGNALHVQAQEVAPACGVVATASVRFQYRPAGGNWLDIPSALAQYPNPDLTAPFFTKWDVTGLPEGNYDLRAVASAGSASDPEPGFINVIVDHHQPQLAESRSADNSSAARGAVERGRVSVAANGQAEVTFAPGSLAVDTTLMLASLPPERLPAGSGTLLTTPVDLSLASGQTTFAAGSEVGVGLPYIDANNDGVIDGSGCFATDVELVAYNAQTQTWEALPGAGVDLQEKKVLGTTTHFSLFGTRGKSGLPQAAGIGAVYQPATSTTGNYQLSWSRSATAGRIYEVQQADDAGFTQNLTSLYSGPNNYVNVSNAGNGDRYYRIRVVAPGHGPSAWKADSSPVSVALTCGAPGVLYAPTTSSTGTFQLSWSRSNIPAVSYDLEVDDGRGFQYLGRTSNNYFNLSGIPDGSYVYRVKATKAGYADSGWKPAPALTVALACGTPGALYAPTASTTGSYQLSWSRSNITGSTYVLEESKDGGAYVTVYSGPNNYANFSGKGSGSYVYRVKALKTGYADSGWKPAPLLTVALTCGTPGALYAPTASSTGSYQLSWSRSNITGSTYVLEESKDGGAYATVYSGPNNYATLSGKGNGSYVYRVKAIKAGYADSDWRQSGAVVVP